MAKNHQTDNALFKALVKQYESEIASAYATLTVYFDSPVAIGEHPQHLEEMDKLVDKVSSAEDKLKALNKHFNNKFYTDVPIGLTTKGSRSTFLINRDLLTRFKVNVNPNRKFILSKWIERSDGNNTKGVNISPFK